MADLPPGYRVLNDGPGREVLVHDAWEEGYVFPTVEDATAYARELADACAGSDPSMSDSRGYGLLLTAYPPEGEYERWELTAQDTGELLLAGAFPVDLAAVQEAGAAYHCRMRQNERVMQLVRAFS